MDNNNKNEKIKKIRRILLLKINEELKDILKYKSKIKINSRTIPELNKLYTLSDIQLFEKPALYSHYVKTEERSVSKDKSIEKPQLKISKSVNKMRTRAKSKVNIKVERHKRSSFEDFASPLDSFFPKKIELGRKKMPPSKAKNKGSIPNIHHKGINLEKFNENKRALMSQSTRMNKHELHLNRLIGRITIIKDYKINEEIIKASIKKLRNYCYQLRKKRKKPRKLTNYNGDKQTKEKGVPQKRNALKGSGVLKTSDTLIKNVEVSFFENYMNGSRKNIQKSPNLAITHNKKKYSKISLKSLSPTKHGDKVKKALFLIEKKNKYNKGKKSNKNSIKTTINMSAFENNAVPDVFQIHKSKIPFFHRTTVNVNEDDAIEGKKEKKRSSKKVTVKDNIHLRKKSKILDKQPQLPSQQPQETNNTKNNFLNINYVYHRNNNKKKTNLEIQRIPSHKKLTKFEPRKESNGDNLAIIKLAKVNNGEMQKKIKKRPVKDRREFRPSYISSETEKNGFY